MECNTKIPAVSLKKCKKCAINLCESCFKKHGNICIWCLQAAADRPLWLVRISKVLIAMSPLIGFFVPAPIPIIFLLQTNQVNWLWGFFYTGIFLMISGILLASARAAVLKSIIVTEPSSTTSTHAIDVLDVDKSLLQTTTPGRDAGLFTTFEKTIESSNARPLIQIPPSPVPNGQSQSELPGTQMQDPAPSTTTQDITAIKEKQTSYAPTDSIDFMLKLEKVNCPNCGKLANSSSVVCPYCGYNRL